VIDRLRSIRPSLAAQVYFRSGLKAEAAEIGEAALHDVLERDVSGADMEELAGMFYEIGLWDEFERVADKRYPPHVVAELRERVGIRRRPR